MELIGRMNIMQGLGDCFGLSLPKKYLDHLLDKLFTEDMSLWLFYYLSYSRPEDFFGFIVSPFIA
jgi:hypothetical protein